MVSAALTRSGTIITRTCGKIIPTIRPWRKAAMSRLVMWSDIWDAQATALRKIPTILMSLICTLACSWFLTNPRRTGTTRSGSVAMSWPDSSLPTVPRRSKTRKPRNTTGSARWRILSSPAGQSRRVLPNHNNSINGTFRGQEAARLDCRKTPDT